LGDLIVRGLALVGIADFDIFSDSVDPSYAPRCRDRGELLRVTVHVSAQGYDVRVNGYANMLAVEAGIEFEFVDDILAKLDFFHDFPR